MAKLLRRYRDSITGLLVENGMSKADAKTYLKTAPSGTELGNQLYDLYLASLQQEMNDYAAMHGTAIDLFSDNGNATQVIAAAVQGKLSSSQGMDGSGNYYDQIYFNTVNSHTTTMIVLSKRGHNLINEELEKLYDDANILSIRAEKHGANSKSYSRSISAMNYIENATTAFNAGPPTDLQALLGPYYSEPNLNTRIPGRVNYRSPSDYYYYTSELTVPNTYNADLPPLGLVFAIQQVAAENVPSLSQALHGDATINFADAPVMNVLYLLGAGANGTQQNQDLIINHEDGSSESYSLTFTDWANNKNTKSKKSPTLGENTKIGQNEFVLQDFFKYVNKKGDPEQYYRYMFGYAVKVESTSPVSSIDFNFDDNVKILAASYL